MGSLISFFNKKPAKISSKVILITGASSGIGKDAALALIQRGHIVYGAARRIDQLQDLVEAGGHAIKMDITDEHQVVAAVKRILQEQEHHIDVLVNNSGFSIAGAAEEASIADGRRQFDVNLFGLVRLTQEILPHMREQNKGTIINISSAGRVYFPFNAWYIATKNALEGWTDCLRLEVKPFNIKVSIVGAGAINTDFDKVMDSNETSDNNNNKQTSVYHEYYENALHNIHTVMRKYGSPPSVVSNAIVKAVESRNPKRKYIVGFTARPMLFLRNWCGEAVYEAVFMRTMKVKM